MLPRNKIFVGSLPPSTKPEEIRRLFENYGVVTECDVMNRCAFVHMQTPDMMDNAIQALHNSQFKGVTINVERGRTKERAPGSGSDGGESGGGGRGGFRGGRGGFNQQNRSNYDDNDRSGGPMRNNRGNMRNQPYGSGGGGAGRGGSFDGQNQGGGGGGGGGFRGGFNNRGGGRGDFNDRGSGGRGGGGHNNSSGGSGGSRFSGGQQSEDRRGFALPNDSGDRFNAARSGGLAMSSFKDPFIRRSIGDAPAGPSAPYVNRGVYSQGNTAATALATTNYNQAFPPLGSDSSRNTSRGPAPPQQPQQQQRWMQ
ncbi:heterogeneous nuclear ribonucleoprotein A3 homolog 1 [Armigeres subalbatus]|uniref:heterogeneous nuclear ribonucleoprotein A3 homolog 1 n=1 Tax=Armigeres subalbatus TaxID=124917 RepID=UPI002ED137B2